MRRWIVAVVALWLLIGATGLALLLWLRQPLALASASVEITVEAGMSPREIARAWVSAGIKTEPWLLYQSFRWSGQARLIRAGTYEIGEGTTPRQLLDKMVTGDETLETVQIIEGWTFAQMRAALAATDSLRHDSATLTEAALMAAIGASGVAAEGHFFPDTYAFGRGTSDLRVYARAYRSMKRQLDQVWAERQPDLPLADPEDLLKLASIVEKETGHASDRGRIAGVFINRLRIGMPLQTDPTVIYGLGERFDGNLRRRDLEQDSPYNTYLRKGLTPTPIALPGLRSLQAAAHPDPTSALFFVARGDGTSQFSDNLADHNRAVNEFQRRSADR
jgi:UPF0755 protein